MSEIFQVPAYISHVKTMAKSLRIYIDTQENLTPDSEARIFQWRNQLGHFLFAVRQIEKDDMLDLPKLIKTEKKSQSKKLREALFLLWSQNNNNYEAFDDYYVWYTDYLIDKIRDKLV